MRSTTVEWSLFAVLCAVVVLIIVRGAPPSDELPGPADVVSDGASDAATHGATDGATDAATGSATDAGRALLGEPAADTASDAAQLPPVQFADLGALSEALRTSEAPAPIQRPLLAATSLSEGLPTVGQWRGSSLLADLDADGRLDLVTSVRRLDSATPGEGLMVWLGNGAGAWTPAIEGLRRDMGYGGSAVADIDGDGRRDLAFSGHDVPPQVFLGDGGGGWRLQVGAADDVPAMCADVALGDVDGDGLADLASLAFHRDQGGLFLHAGVGGGAFVRMPDLLSEGVFGAQVEMPDLDGDGVHELVATTSEGPRVWRWEAGLPVDMSAGLPKPEIGGSDLGLDARDLDGDGFAELLVTGMTYPGHDPLCVYRWDGQAWQRWGAGLPQDEACFDGVFADLQGDGRAWLVLAGKFGIGLVRASRSGQFVSVGRLQDTEGVFNVAAGDVDGDGRDEIVFVGIGGVRVLRPELPAQAGLAEGESS